MNYKTEGVCAKEIEFYVEDNIVKNVKFIKGCDGNLSGIASLVEGMKVGEVIKKLSGIQCGDSSTSCPDQLAKALTEAINK